MLTCELLVRVENVSKVGFSSQLLGSTTIPEVRRMMSMIIHTKGQRGKCSVV